MNTRSGSRNLLNSSGIRDYNKHLNPPIMDARHNKDPHHLSDGEVIRRVISGDVDAFESLITRYKHHVWQIAKKHVPHAHVEEITQDVFVKAYQALSKFKGNRPFKNWLSAIATRTCYDFWRQQYKHRSREVLMSQLSESQKHWLGNVLAEMSWQQMTDQRNRKEAKAILQWALNQLSPEDRMVMQLAYLDELPSREVARLMGWSRANVKVRMYRCRKKLNKLLVDL